MTTTDPKGIFVLGSPRSGTSLVGAYLGSAPSICSLGEYAGFHLAHSIAPRVFTRIPATEKDRYLNSIQQHAEVFATAVAEEAGASFYLDATPWNLLIIDELLASHPAIETTAIFVLCLRDYRGVVQSLERSFDNGYRWAGSTVGQRAALWASFYSKVGSLPLERTVVMSYDLLCREPETELEHLRDRLEQVGVPINEVNEEVFAVTHATEPSEHRPTIATLKDGTISYRTIPAFDPDRWEEAELSEAEPHVNAVDEELRDRFGARYSPATE